MTSVRRALTILAGLTFAALPQVAEGQQTCTPRPVARIESVKNTVQLVQVSTRASVPATRDGQVCAGDTIQVGDNSRAVVLMLGSNTPLVIDQNSAFVVTEAPTSGGTVIDLVRGAFLFITRIRRAIENQVLPAASVAELAAVPDATRDAAFYVRRAGQLDEASADLNQAQKLEPANGDADALRAVVAVALNDKGGA